MKEVLEEMELVVDDLEFQVKQIDLHLEANNLLESSSFSKVKENKKQEDSIDAIIMTLPIKGGKTNEISIIEKLLMRLPREAVSNVTSIIIKDIIEGPKQEEINEEIKDLQKEKYSFIYSNYEGSIIINRKGFEASNFQEQFYKIIAKFLSLPHKLEEVFPRFVLDPTVLFETSQEAYLAIDKYLTSKQLEELGKQPKIKLFKPKSSRKYKKISGKKI